MSLITDTIAAIEPTCLHARSQASERLDSLAMPRQAMGRLMELAERLAGMTGHRSDERFCPPLSRRVSLVFAGDHGVVEEGVSQYPQAVTRAMVDTMLRGKATINALAATANSRVIVVDMGIIGDRSWGKNDQFFDRRVSEGTKNLAVGPAMTPAQAVLSLEAGIDVAKELGQSQNTSDPVAGFDVVAMGEMGIGNTTPATAIGCALMNLSPEKFTGPGTGIEESAVAEKAAVIQRSLDINQPNTSDAIDVLGKLGGFEIGGMAGAMLAAASMRKPILLDGLISTSAALIACALCPRAADWMIASHLSSEPLHQKMLEHLNLRPYLDLDLRLGEGSGAALLMPLLDSAASLLSDVATLDEVLH